jgi:hypothetical protein
MLRQSTTCRLSRPATRKRIGSGRLPAGAGNKEDKEAPPVLDMISSLLGALTGAFGTLTTFVALVLGLLSLFLGRRFFRLFIGLAGFAVGLVLS